MSTNYLALANYSFPTVNASSITVGSSINMNRATFSTLTGSTITVSTLTGSTLMGPTLMVSTIAFQSTTIALGQSTSQAYNNFTNGSFTAGWVSSLSTTASTAGAGLARVQKVTMSQSGQYQLAVQSSVASYSVVKSSDSGVTWQTLTNGSNGLPKGAVAYPQATATGNPAYTSVSYSATGQYALASVSGGLLYVSNNATVATPTFTAIGPTAPTIYMPFEGAVTDVIGNVASTINGSMAYVTGIVGTQALNLVNTAGASGNTATNYIRYTVPTNMTSFTISGRFNSQSAATTGFPTILSMYSQALVLFINSSSNSALYLNYPTGTGSGQASIFTKTGISLNTWYSFTIIYQIGTVSFYVNNELIGTGTSTGLGTFTGSTLGLACYDSSTAQPFNGYIDDLRIYNSAVAFSLITPSNWSHTAVSATGQYMLAASSPSGSGGGLFQSSNYGQTWTQVNALLNGGVWTSLSQSYSGQYALATTSAATITPQSTSLATYTWAVNGVSWAVSASSFLATTWYPYMAFNNSLGSDFNIWASAASYNTTGAYTGSTSTTISGIGAVTGEWLQLQSSIPLVMSTYIMTSGNSTNHTKSYVIAGSNDGTTWYAIQSAAWAADPFGAYTTLSTYINANFTGTQAFTSSTTQNLVTTSYATSTNAYLYFRAIGTANFANAQSAYYEIGEWYINFAGGLTYTSNYGQTWSNNNFLGASQSFSAISGDGQYALTGTGQTAYLISNYIGLATQSYTPITLPSINANINCASCSNTGQYMTILTQGTTNNVYYSINYGSTWTALTVGSSAMTSCAMSADGTYITVSNATNVYTLNWNGQGFTVAMGSAAGAVNQANNAIAIGNQAGQTNQTANSIVLNASGSTVNPYTQGFYVAPVQPAISSTALTFPLLGYGSDNQIVQSATSFSNQQQTVYGEWIQYQLATPSPITSYTLQSRPLWLARYPASWIIVGSNDGTNWLLLDTQTGTSGWGTYTLTQVAASYTYYRLIMTQISSAAAYYINMNGFTLNNGSPIFGSSANYTVVASGNYNVLQLNGTTVCTTTWSWPNTVNSLGIGADPVNQYATYQPGWLPTPDGYKIANYFLGFGVTGFGPQYEYNSSGIAVQGTSTTINTTVLGNTNMSGMLCLMGNSRVGIGSTVPQYALDVAGTVQANGLIPAVGQSDSATVVPNTTFGQTWQQLSGLATGTALYGCAMSATGQYMTVSIYGAASGNNIYYSTNYGASWTLATGFLANAAYFAIGMSGNGQYQLATIDLASSALYVSSNYGATWSATAYTIGSASGRNVSLSYNGQYQFAATVNTGYVVMSSNYGATFANSSLANGSWTGVCCSYSGQYVSACASGGSIWYSSNYGVTWTSSGVANANWNIMCCSSSGQYQIANASSNYIYYSNNYGVSWAASNLTKTSWGAMACTSSGQYVVAAVNNNYVYYSTNYGITWTQSGTPSGNWNAIAISQNGLYTLACVYAGTGAYLSTLANVGLVTNGRIGIGLTNPSSALQMGLGLTTDLGGALKTSYTDTGITAASLVANINGTRTGPSGSTYTFTTSGTNGSLTATSVANIPPGSYVTLSITCNITSGSGLAAFFNGTNSYVTPTLTSSMQSFTFQFVAGTQLLCTIVSATGTVFNWNSFSVQRLDTNAMGFVGIGTTAPSARLQITDANMNRLTGIYVGPSPQSGIVLDSTSGASGRSFNIWSTSSADSAGVGSLVFFDITAGVYRMVINSSGNVLVNATSTFGNGVIQVVSGTGTTQDGMSCKAAYDTNTVYASHNTAGTYRGGIQGVNSTSITYATSSDRRLKDNIHRIEGSLGIVNQLNPVHFRWINDDQYDFGFIAQEVYKVLPHLRPNFSSYIKDCTCLKNDLWNGIQCDHCLSMNDEPVDEDGKPRYYSLDYGKFTPYLMGAIHELTERVVQLESENAMQETIRTQIGEVLARLAALESK